MQDTWRPFEGRCYRIDADMSIRMVVIEDENEDEDENMDYEVENESWNMDCAAGDAMHQPGGCGGGGGGGVVVRCRDDEHRIGPDHGATITTVAAAGRVRSRHGELPEMAWQSGTIEILGVDSFRLGRLVAESNKAKVARSWSGPVLVARVRGVVLPCWAMARLR